MRSTPSQLGTRYLPFLVVAAVLCLLVVVTPSTGPRRSDVASDSFTGRGADGGGGADGAGGATDGAAATGDGTDVGAGGDPAGPTTGASGGPGSAVAGGGGATGGAAGGPGASTRPTPTGGAGPGAAAGPAGGDRSNCDAKGMQKGPVYPLDVPCRARFSGSNGGATMRGVTPTEIRYTWYNPPENAVVNGLLAGAGFAHEPEPFCRTMRAFEVSLQKYYEMSGRKLVAVDGPGNQAGSSRCGGNYRFFQSNCNNNAIDPPCLRSDAQVIATQMNVAFVLAPRGLVPLFEELGKRQVITLGYSGSRARFQSFAPYLWSNGLGTERMFGLHAEYFCARLAGKPPAYGGADVKRAPFPANRHIGLIVPDNGDGSLQPAVDLWLRTVKACGDPNAKVFTYQGDVTRAQQQASSIVGQMRADGITTIGACCDPVSNVFFLQALEQNRYFPEHFVMPSSSIASDAAGNVYEDLGLGGQWNHAFGISNFAVNQNDKTLSYRKAYADGGGAGGTAGVAAIEIESFGAIFQMLQMIHQAGPGLTAKAVFDGMQALPAIAPSKLSPGYDYAAPDPFQPQLDVSEIWWNPDLYSYYSDTKGAMCHTNDARRYGPGQVPKSPPNLFAGGNAACSRLVPGT